MVGLRLRLSMVVALLALGWFTIGWQTADQLAAGDEDKVATAPAAEESESDDAKPEEDEAKDEKDEAKKDEDKSEDKDKKPAPKDNKAKKKTPAKTSKTPVSTKKSSGIKSSAGRAGGSSGTAGLGGAGAVGGGASSGAASGGWSNFANPAQPPKAGERSFPRPSMDQVAATFKVQRDSSPALMKQEGIVGTGTTYDKKDGKLKIMVFTSGAGSPTIPKEINGIPVVEKMTGLINELQAPVPTQQQFLPRPVPIGTSVAPVLPGCANFNCYSGTLGCRLKARDGSGTYALSNNHVFANSDLAPVGTPQLQPSPGEGITACNCNLANQVGTLFKVKPFLLDPRSVNTIDAAIMKTDPSLVGNSTLPDGYGTPKSRIIPLPDSRIIDVSAFHLGGFVFPFQLDVQKYGRTSGLTYGITDALNCIVIIQGSTGAKLYNDQIMFFGAGPSFSLGGPGDSGSLIVTLDRHPVALLYAGGGLVTFGNPIGKVLDYFDMDIDGEGEALPPGKNGKGQPNTK